MVIRSGVGLVYVEEGLRRLEYRYCPGQDRCKWGIVESRHWVPRVGESQCVGLCKQYHEEGRDETIRREAL